MLKLSDLNKYTRFTFLKKDKIYQFRGIEDNAFVYFEVNSKSKFPKVFKTFKDKEISKVLY